MLKWAELPPRGLASDEDVVNSDDVSSERNSDVALDTGVADDVPMVSAGMAWEVNDGEAKILEGF